MFDYVVDLPFVAYGNSIGLQFDLGCRMNVEMMLVKILYLSVLSNGGGGSIYHEISYVNLVLFLPLMPRLPYSFYFSTRSCYGVTTIRG